MEQVQQRPKDGLKIQYRLKKLIWKYFKNKMPQVYVV